MVSVKSFEITNLERHRICCVKLCWMTHEIYCFIDLAKLNVYIFAFNFKLTDKWCNKCRNIFGLVKSMNLQMYWCTDTHHRTTGSFSFSLSISYLRQLYMSCVNLTFMILWINILTMKNTIDQILCFRTFTTLVRYLDILNYLFKIWKMIPLKLLLFILKNLTKYIFHYFYIHRFLHLYIFSSNFFHKIHFYHFRQLNKNENICK